ncbi:hypothetical protein [Nonomuraea sp. 10N515B]|uniref:hypothetical protein n=1 Tax=Nonomuraea sp. 10N515B TaxID=3457422 RepID=UPI003FCE3091
MTHRTFGRVDAFDPEQGLLVMPPETTGAGYWTGCPGVLYEPERGRFLMTYRQRRPRGDARERGWRCAIAESADGLSFTDIWAVEKEELKTSSMERFCLLPDGDGYLLYLSYVDPADSRWRVDVCRAGGDAAFDVATAEPVLTAASTGTEGVKDPYAVRIGPAIYLFASFAADAGLDEAARARAHSTGDIYNVGGTSCPTGLAVGLDGRTFDWRGPVLETGHGWDRYQARLNSFAALPGGGYLGFYDGSSGPAENYEERTGLALSFNLIDWQRLTPAGPWVTSGTNTGSIRYMDVVPVGEQWWLYYEMTRADGSHELRVTRIPRPANEKGDRSWAC